MKKILTLFVLLIIIVLTGCEKQQLTCHITYPHSGQDVLISKDLIVRIDVEATKSTVANVVVSYDNMLSSSTSSYQEVLTSEPYSVTIPAFALLLGKNTIKAVATGTDGTQAESSVTVYVVEVFDDSKKESPDFVTFDDGIIPTGWMTYTWDIADIGFDDNYSVRSANSTAIIYANKTMHAPSYIQFYTKGDDIILYINDVKAKAQLSEPTSNDWVKWIYPVDSGTHVFRWQTAGSYKYLDAITFYY